MEETVTATAMTAVTTGITNLFTIVTSSFTAITGNEILVVVLAASLVGVALRTFSRMKSAVR